MPQSSFSRGILTEQCFLLSSRIGSRTWIVVSNIPLNSSDAGVILESFPDLESQQARNHEVDDTELLCSC